MKTSRPIRRPAGAFTLLEVMIALALVAIGFLGAFAMTVQSGKMVAAAEEEALVCSGLEQRIDQLRELSWPVLTATSVTGSVWSARPESTAGLAVTEETMTISACDAASAKTLQAAWSDTASPTASFTGSGADLSTASAVKVVVTLTWTGRRSGRAQTRSLVTVISKGGISKSDL